MCYALYGFRPLVTTDYVPFMNDDMYVCPEWDTALDDEIQAIGHKMFFLSATLIQPRPFFCKSVIAPANYGETVDTFEEGRLLREYRHLTHGDWLGATWPPNIVHKGPMGLKRSEATAWSSSPGMYTDPDFSAKLWHAGVRLFKGVDRSRVYHFEARSTHRIVKNDGSLQFLRKWGITSSSFMRDVLHRGESPFRVPPIRRNSCVKQILRSKWKRAPHHLQVNESQGYLDGII